MKLEFNPIKFIAIPNLFSGPALARLKRSLFTILLRQKDKLFKNGVDPDGNPWTPLADGSAKRKESKNRSDLDEVQARREKEGKPKLSKHKILIDTGALKNSLTQSGAPYQIQSVKPLEVSIGTNLPYAAIHNFGGVISRRTKNGAATIKIPARKFMGFGDADDRQVNEKIQAFLKKGG